MSVAVEWISLRRPTQQAGPSSSVVGRHQPGDSVNLGSGKGPPSVALEQQIGPQKRLHHGWSHDEIFCHCCHHSRHDGHQKGQQDSGRWHRLKGH